MVSCVYLKSRNWRFWSFASAATTQILGSPRLTVQPAVSSRTDPFQALLTESDYFHTPFRLTQIKLLHVLDFLPISTCLRECLFWRPARFDSGAESHSCPELSGFSSLYLFTACQLDQQVFALKPTLPHWIQIRKVCLFWRGHKRTGDLFWVSFCERCRVTSHQLSSRSKSDLSHTSNFCMDFLYTSAEINLNSIILQTEFTIAS